MKRFLSSEKKTQSIFLQTSKQILPLHTFLLYFGNWFFFGMGQTEKIVV
jgi:hypothetical protein